MFTYVHECIYKPVRRSKEDAEETRRALLDAALKVFGRDGFAATRLDDIAKEAGVTRGAIAHHFGGKIEIWRALSARREEVVSTVAKRVAEAGGTPIERLRGLMIALAGELEDNEEYRAVWSLIVFHRAGSPPEVRETEVERHRDDAYERGIARIVRAGIEKGLFHPDLDTRTVARAFFALSAGLAVNWLTAPDVFSIKEEAPRIADLFLNGVLKRN